MTKHFKLFMPLAPYLYGLIAIFSIAGCGSIAPAYQRPQAPIPASWPVQSGPGADTRAALPDWQHYFTDPTSRQLIAVALRNNRDLRVTTLAIEQARAQLGLRQADLLPALNLTLGGTRTPTTSGRISTTYSGALTVTAYELDLFGRVASLKDQALAQYLATRETALAAQTSLIATVAQSWLALLSDTDMLRAAQMTLATREASLKLIELRLSVGAASELERRSAQTLTESARVTLAQLQRQCALDENALTLLLGEAMPQAARDVLGAAPTDGAASTATEMASATLLGRLHFVDIPAGLPSDLLTRRPDIRAAERVLQASNANIGAARAAFFPRISLTAGLGSVSAALSDLFQNGTWGLTISPQLLMPIFDAGRNQSNLDAAMVTRDIAVAQYEKAIQSAFREVADALAARTTLAQQLQASSALYGAESERARLTKLRLDVGAASQLDWLDAQRSLFAAQQTLLQTQLAVLQNQVVLYKVLGGGILSPDLHETYTDHVFRAE